MTRIRSRKLIKSGLQLRLILVFVSLGCLAALFQVVMLNHTLLELARSSPHGSDRFLAALPSLLAQNLVVTLLALVPLMVGVGLLVTHKVAGPVYRFEQHLQEVARGGDPGPCRIRKGDELQELCGHLNDALAALRSGGRSEEPAEPELPRRAG